MRSTDPTAATRTESDTHGEIDVPADRYWGAQAERSRQNFRIGTERQSTSLIHALAIIKRAAADVNGAAGDLAPELAEAISAAATEVAAGEYDDHFPLVVWQTGSGTQTNMNVNEVVANLAIERLGGTVGSRSPVHPNDHVNLGQSSNDTYPSAMQIAATSEIEARLLPALRHLHGVLSYKADAWRAIVKIGRTHTMDAVPLTLGQEFSGYAQQIANAIDHIEATLARLMQLPQGGTAVGTATNAAADFGDRVVARIAEITGLGFTPSPNKFEAIASRDACVATHGAINTAAVSLFKIANDIRFLGSGPRAGLGELSLPANEPGSSIMPGKINPTQCEAATQVCVQIFGNNAAVTFAGSQGHFELNAYAPLIAYNLLQSIRLLSDVSRSFADKCVAGIEPNIDNIRDNLEQSLMLVTALAPRIGYDAAAAIAKAAHANGTTLRTEAVGGGYVSEKEYDALVDPQKMCGPI